ncbi:ABC transporter ATP-binding protein [Paenibacillus vini]|uniref:ABC transporter ATP-binding protein n=1 Tax=Paenibacillus vini TaxID=1476024 RepID=UPI0025B664A2|nr:ABC transporter ATP-binding protein [Paenibacillus vini]MDN4066694.1 ABC transporter ATP-binding protein [Paenibacillus vini]
MKETVRWIYIYIKQNEKLYSLNILLKISMVMAGLCMTGLQKFLIDEVFLKAQYELFLSILLLFVAAFLIYNLGFVWGALMDVKVASRLERVFYRDFYQYLHALPADHYRELGANKLHSILKRYIQSGREMMKALPLGIQNLFNMLLLIGIIGYTNLMLLLMIVIFSCLYIFVGRKFVAPIKLFSKQRNEQRTKVDVTIEEGISSTREIIAFRRQDWEQQRLNYSFDLYYKKVKELLKVTNRQLMWTDLLKWGANFAILVYGGHLMLQGSITLGVFVVIYQYNSQLIDSINKVYTSFISVIEETVQLEHTHHLFKERKLMDGSLLIQGEMKELTIENISYRYAGNPNEIISDFSLQMKLGKKVGIVGRSGSGKSTVATLLTALVQPQKGDILINNISIFKLNRSYFSKHISVVFQEPYFFSDTIISNLTLGRSYRLEQIEEACRSAEIHDTIVNLPLGYDTMLGERGATLSGGQRQRLALARAMLSSPDILILDEATSALDHVMEQRIQKTLDQLRKGRTTIIITHRFETLYTADVIYVFDQGQIIESGTHEELLDTNKIYQKMFVTSCKEH